ncbi:hypothetical protein BDM02DRAFT_3120219 [Thelephora ganbajun]|uniref:Uncharacterized protein n=1 Tax=Thelephora ganbajun TaxID=370292 RepID=A0ACB6Z6U2_THEGA|nr:hypothetical protein BDM02DRAFT_3120219 [Thelephora ganbajun]
MSSDPSKTSGNVKNTVGKVEEAIGNLTGLESLQTSGKKRQAEGDVEYKQAQAQGYVEGTTDRVSGTIENVKGSLTGDTSQEISGDVRKEKGKVQQDANKP